MPYLSLEISKHSIEFLKVRVEPVKPLAPTPPRLFRREFQNGKISQAGLAVTQAGKVFAKKSDGVLANNLFAFVHGKYSSQHSLILRMRLAEVKIRHTLTLSVAMQETGIVRVCFY
jgi:hypothetical protein